MLYKGQTFYSIVLHDRRGEIFDIPCQQQLIDPTLQVLRERAPWAIAGFSQQLKDLWEGDRSQMLEFVEQHASQVAGGVNPS